MYAMDSYASSAVAIREHPTSVAGRDTHLLRLPEVMVVYVKLCKLTDTTGIQ